VNNNEKAIREGSYKATENKGVEMRIFGYKIEIPMSLIFFIVAFIILCGFLFGFNPLNLLSMSKEQWTILLARSFMIFIGLSLVIMGFESQIRFRKRSKNMASIIVIMIGFFLILVAIGLVLLPIPW
jgi:magnesium-transporting ATPase (P-type)